MPTEGSMASPNPPPDEKDEWGTFKEVRKSLINPQLRARLGGYSRTKAKAKIARVHNTTLLYGHPLLKALVWFWIIDETYVY